MNARIRTAQHRDRDAIRDIHLCAFPAAENQLVATLAVDLLDQAADAETLSLVADAAGDVAGHVAFSPVTSGASDEWLGYILAPLAVKPGYQNGGIGSRLVESGLERLRERGVDVVFVYGDPNYYRRFGFNAKSATHFLPPCELSYPFGWQALMLREDGYGETAVAISCVAPLRDPALW